MVKSPFCRQVFLLTQSNLTARYRKTFAGFIWVVVNPLILFGAQSVAFKNFLNLDVPDYYLFLLGNLLPWIFLINSLTMSASILEERAILLRSFSMNPFILVSAQVLDNFFNFLAAFIILLVPMLFIYNVSFLGLVNLILAVTVLVFGALIISTIAAITNVFYRDTKFLVNFISSVLFFLTPVFYPLEFIPEKFHVLVNFNIFYLLISPVRMCLYQFEYVSFLWAMLQAVCAVMVLIFIFYWFWRSKENEFYFRL